MADDELTPQQWLARLRHQHDQERPVLERLDEHYEGEQPLSYMAPELVDELSDRIRQVIVAWPQLVVDSAEERLDVEGFRNGEAEADEDLEAIWQANDMDAGSQKAHLDALVMRRAYAIVGANEDDDSMPLITVESPLEVAHHRCPRTRRILAAAKWWTEGEGSDRVDHATLYLPDVTSWWVKDGGDWKPSPKDAPDEHGLGVVPVEPIVNRPRLRPRKGCEEGVSDLSAVIPLSDAACKIMTDMMVAAEYHAVPRRVALGFDEADFVDENGNPVGAFARAIGRVWATEKTRQDGADVLQFPETNLSNFHDTIKLLASVTAAVSGLTPQMLGLTTDQPASADAIRAAEARLVKRVERKQKAFGGSWARVMRLALLIRDGQLDPRAARLQTIWADAATPTVAQRADAAVKLHQAAIVPLRQTREDLGYSPPQIERMEEEDERDAALALGLAPAPKRPAAGPGGVPGMEDGMGDPGDAGDTQDSQSMGGAPAAD